MPTPRPPSLLAQPSYLASQISKHGRRRLEQALREYDVALIQDAVLSALDDLGPLSQQELANCLDLHKSHLVAPIDALEGRALLKRARDPADRRRNQVALTASGQVLVQKLHTVGMRSQRELLDTLSPTERKTLERLLRRVLVANDDARASSWMHDP